MKGEQMKIKVIYRSSIRRSFYRTSWNSVLFLDFNFRIGMLHCGRKINDISGELEIRAGRGLVLIDTEQLLAFNVTNITSFTNSVTPSTASEV